MILKKEQKGFGIIPILIFFVVIGLIGVTGWSSWSSNKAANYSDFDDCIKKGGKELSANDFRVCSTEDRAYLQYSAQNLPRIEEQKKSEKENKVEYSGSYSQDLITFLRYDYTGCETSGYYKIIKEVTGRFALMNYGCDGANNDGSFIIAMKLSNGWSLISPTNNISEKGVPSCLMVDIFKISKELSDKCFENTGFNNGSIKQVEYL